MMHPFKVTIALAGLLTATTGGHAIANCDLSSLSGQYASKAQGATVGVFDSSGTLHPLASPQLISSVSQFSFDGAGSFTRVDFAVGNGTPQITSTTPLTDSGFRSGQTGSYTVDADCTGTMTLDVPGGTEIVFAIAIGSYGQVAFGVVKSEHISGLPPAIVPAGTSCDSGCNIGVNLLIDLTKNVYRR